MADVEQLAAELEAKLSLTRTTFASIRSLPLDSPRDGAIAVRVFVAVVSEMRRVSHPR